MSYEHRLHKKIIKLLENPKENFYKIKPFLISRYLFYKRKMLEKFENDKLSKPYPGHEKIIKELNKKNGFFIQVGGNDGYFMDPVYYYEKFLGWKGIIIEPLPISFLCKKNRNNSKIIEKAIVSPTYKNKTVEFIDCNAMSLIKNSSPEEKIWIQEGEKCQKITSRTINVPCATLQKIIDDDFITQKIDLLVLDIEGYEYEALTGLDFKKQSPEYILFEAHTFDKKKTDCKFFISI